MTACQNPPAQELPDQAGEAFICEPVRMATASGIQRRADNKQQQGNQREDIDTHGDHLPFFVLFSPSPRCTRTPLGGPATARRLQPDRLQQQIRCLLIQFLVAPRLQSA